MSFISFNPKNNLTALSCSRAPKACVTERPSGNRNCNLADVGAGLFGEAELTGGAGAGVGTITGASSAVFPRLASLKTKCIQS